MQIAIIGAGISGLYLSWKLSEKGHKTTVFERKKEIGQKACSGLFSERILSFFPQSEYLIKNRINHALIHFPRKTVGVDFQKEFFVIEHSELDKLAADLAKKAGAEIVLDRNIEKIPQDFEKVIGADGPDSFVRKSLNLPDPKYRLGILGFVQGRTSDNFVQAWPVKQGFIWKIPRGENTEYGILAPINTARNQLNAFLQKNNIILDNLKAKLVPQGLILPKNKNITLAGDAAGITKPWSGGGVIWQLTLADILLKTFPDFLKYRKKARKQFYLRLALSKKAVDLVCFLGNNLPFLIGLKINIESDFLIKKSRSS